MFTTVPRPRTFGLSLRRSFFLSAVLPVICGLACGQSAKQAKQQADRKALAHAAVEAARSERIGRRCSEPDAPKDLCLALQAGGGVQSVTDVAARLWPKKVPPSARGSREPVGPQKWVTEAAPAEAGTERSRCDVQVNGRGFEIPRQAEARIFFVGAVGAVKNEERQGVDDLFQASLRLPPQAQITSVHDLETLLTTEKTRDLLGCSSTSCIAEIGGALGAEFLVSLTLARIGDSSIMTAKAIDARTASVVGNVVAEFEDIGCVRAALRATAQRVFVVSQN